MVHALGIEPEQLCRIRHQNFLELRIVGRIAIEQLQQIRVVRHKYGRLCRAPPFSARSGKSLPQTAAYNRISSSDSCLYHAEQARGVNGWFAEAGFAKQVAVLPFRSLQTARSAKHIEVAECLLPL